MILISPMRPGRFGVPDGPFATLYEMYCGVVSSGLVKRPKKRIKAASSKKRRQRS